MRFLIILTAIVLLPVMMIAHLWDYTENHQSRLVQQARDILKDCGVRGGTVNLSYLDLSVTGDAPNMASFRRAQRELSSLGPLRLVSNRLTILANVRAVLVKDTLTVDGWLPDQDTADSLRGLLLKVRPDLNVVTEGLKISPLARWPEGEKLPLGEDSLMLEPILKALRVPAVLEVVRQDGRLTASGIVSTQELKEAVAAALGQRIHGLAVDVSKLRVSSHLLPASFIQGEAIVPFLTSFYGTPSPGDFSIRSGENPRLKADTTRTLESLWLGYLRPVTKGARVEMDLTWHPSIYHFPGRRIETELPEYVLQSVRDLISGEFIQFGAGSTTLSAEEEARLTGIIPALIAAGPALRLVVGGYPEPGGNMKLEAQLARQRADRVVSFLVGQGTPASDIRAMAFDPVPAGDKHAPPQPRCVEILIQ